MKNITHFSRRAAFAAVIALVVSAGSVRADKPPYAENELIAILKSDAPPGDKGVACKRLAIYGTKEAVPELAKLLPNPELSSWARIGLQNIPGPEADAALRDAMGTLKGRLLVGMINSISERHDAKAVPGLIGKLSDADADVASAAAVALGNIGGDDATKALQAKLGDAPAPVRPFVAEGLIIAAEHLLAGEKFADSAKLYDAVRSANVTKQKTLEATRGAILARRADGVPMLKEQLTSNDQAFFNIGLKVARELEGPEATKMILSVLDQAGPERQPYLLLAVADRGGPEALATATKAAKSVHPSMRIAAIGVLERLADPSSIPVLMNAASDDDPAVAKVAKAAVSHVQGKEIDTAIVEMMKKPEEKTRLTAIDIAGQRRTLGAMPELLHAAEDSSPAVSAASLKVIADIATASEVEPLLKIMLKNPQPAVERALASVCVRSARPDSTSVTIQKAFYGDLPDGQKADVTKKVKGLVSQGSFTIEASNAHFGDTAGGHVKKLRIDYTANGIAVSKTVVENESITLAVNSAPPALVDPLCAAMSSAPAAGKQSLLRLLRLAGGAKALAAVRTAATDADAGTKETAVRMLCDWQSSDALPDLAQLAKTSSDEKFKILALRGQLRLIAQQAIPAPEKIAALKEAMPLATRAEEKRLVLAALADIPTTDSLAVIATYLGQDDVKDEAASAALAIAAPIAKKNPAEVIAALEPVSKSANAELAKRANEILAQAKAATKK